MARRHGVGSGPTKQVPIPSDLLPFFTVATFTARLHGGGRGHKRHSKRGHSMHGEARRPDPFHGRYTRQHL